MFYLISAQTSQFVLYSTIYADNNLAIFFYMSIKRKQELNCVTNDCVVLFSFVFKAEYRVFFSCNAGIRLNMLVWRRFCTHARVTISISATYAEKNAEHIDTLYRNH